MLRIQKLIKSAGEDGETIRPTLSYLAANGIGGILDYAAESDVDAEVVPESSCACCTAGMQYFTLHPYLSPLTLVLLSRKPHPPGHAWSAFSPGHVLLQLPRSRINRDVT